MATIHEILPVVALEIGVIGKAHKNTQQNYSFRSVDDVMSHCGPVFMRHGVSVTSCVREHHVTLGERKKGSDVQAVYHATVLMAVTFWAKDGSSLENVAAGEGLDYAGDKATNKAMAAAYKYAMFFGLCIPVDARAIDDSDRPRTKRGAAPAENGNGRNGHDVAPESQALSAIRNAPDEKTLARYEIAARQRIEQMEYTADGAKKIEAAIERRRQEIRGKVPVEA